MPDGAARHTLWRAFVPRWAHLPCPGRARRGSAAAGTRSARREVSAALGCSTAWAEYNQSFVQHPALIARLELTGARGLPTHRGRRSCAFRRLVRHPSMRMARHGRPRARTADLELRERAWRTAGMASSTRPGCRRVGPVPRCGAGTGRARPALRSSIPTACRRRRLRRAVRRHQSDRRELRFH